MATSAPTTTAKHDAKVREQLTEATTKIRVNDVLGGVLVVLAAGLGYVAAVVVLDHFLDLPDWARQLGFAGFVVTLAALGYAMVVRPLRSAVNPLYAAKKVEDATPGAKNSIVNYVDLADENLPESVKAAVAMRAAKSFETADPADAADARTPARAGAAVGAMIVVLAALFLWMSPPRFFSHLGRAVTPFRSVAVASRTTIDVTEPTGGTATVTAGNPVRIAATIGGRIPDPATPDRVRVLIRHNPDQVDAEELPLEPGDTNRDWQVRVPDHLVQNGFWYRVVGGDGSSPEYQVVVRSRPTFTGFTVRYEYPAYLRLRPETTGEPQLEGYRGTVVTLTATANRELANGRLVVAGKDFIPGTVVGEKRDAVRFQFPLDAAGSYRMGFSATTGEENAESPPYPIRIFSDQPPTLTITSPAEEVTLPTTGLLAVDGTVGDDFGIDKVLLRAIVNGRKATKPYRDGKSFQRPADGTFPTAVEYKDSVPLAGLKDDAGRPVPVKAGDVIEYWLEATDNCTVPTANVGQSKSRKVTVVALPPEPKPQEAHKQAADQRQQAEKQHQKQQDKKLDAEQRPANPQPRPDAAEPPKDQQPLQPMGGDQPQGEKKQGDQPQPGDKKPEGQPPMGDPMQGGTPMGGDQPKGSEPKGGEQPKGSDKPMGTEPKGAEQTNPMGGDQTQPTGGSQQPGQPKAGPPSKEQSKKQQDLKTEADRIEQEMKKEAKANAEATEQATKDLQSDDPSKRESAKKTLDKTVGPGQREKAEKAANDLKSDDPKKREDAQRELDDINKQAGELDREMENVRRDPNGKKSEDVERLFKDAAKLNSPDPKERQQAEENLKKELGPENVDELKKKMKDQPPGDPKSDAETKKQIDDMSKKQQGQPGKGGEQKPADPKELSQAMQDLNSPDPKKQQDARNKLDKAMGPDARKQAEQMTKDLKSDDKATREAAEKKLDEARKQESDTQGRKDAEKTANDLKNGTPEQKKAAEQKMKDMAGKGGEPTAEQKKELADAAKDLTSPDPTKREAAEKKIDDAIGKDGRQQAQQMVNDLKSDDPKKREAAEQKLNDMAKQASDAQKKEAEQAAKDIASDDPKRQEAGRQKLDEMMGKDQRRQAEQMAKDLQSKDDATRKAAEQKLKDMQQKGAPKPNQSAADLAQAAKDMASGDPQKRQAAKDKLNEKDRQTAEQMAADLKKAAEEKKAAEKAGDPMAKADAEKKAADAAKQAADKLNERTAGNKPTDEERKQAAEEALSDDPKTAAAGKEKLNDLDRKQKDQDRKAAADAAKDMGSPDANKQKEAADKFDKTDLAKKLQEGLKDQAEKAQNGDKQAAEDLAKNLADLQKQMDDLKKNDPQKAAEALDKLRDLADKMDRQRGPSGVNRPEKVVEANKDFAKRSADLQLQKFEKLKENKELLQRLGYTEADYQRFLDGFAEMAKQEEKPSPDAKTPEKLPEARVRSDEGVGKVETKKDTSGPQGSGTATAPPGYGDAKKRFGEKSKPKDGKN